MSSTRRFATILQLKPAEPTNLQPLELVSMKANGEVAFEHVLPGSYTASLDPSAAQKGSGAQLGATPVVVEADGTHRVTIRR